jgi:DNA-binding GntR family transcriptional regulator
VIARTRAIAVVTRSVDIRAGGGYRIGHLGAPPDERRDPGIRRDEMQRRRDEAAYDTEKLRVVIERVRPQYETAQEVIVESLRQAIFEEILQPRTWLRQEHLATMFETSRIPVGEALRALEYEGLVESQPRRGYTVSSLDRDDIDEIYELRALLEGHAIRVALPLLTDADFQELTELAEAMVNAADPGAQVARREEFYTYLFSVTGRPRLVALITRLRQEVARSLGSKMVEHEPSHHGVILEAIRNGDADGAVAEISAHYRKVSGRFRRFLQEADRSAVATGTVRRSASPRAPAKFAASGTSGHPRTPSTRG